VDHRAARPAIAKLVRDGSLQSSLFDAQDLAEITHPDYAGERLIACRNPLRRRAPGCRAGLASCSLCRELLMGREADGANDRYPGFWLRAWRPDA
jgi:hypothetical protein